MSFQKFIQESVYKSAPLNSNRLVSIADRKDESAISISAWRALLTNRDVYTWKGIPFLKGCTEVALYSMLLYELQPQTIIELGALSGGSAIWIADQLEQFQVKSSIYGIDIDLSLLDEKAKTDSRVHFLEGDCNNISEILPPERLVTFPHPWLIIEDAHVNTITVIEHFHKNGLMSGDYLIIEDTNRTMWELDQEELDKNDLNEQALIKAGTQKLVELRCWLLHHENEYLVDTYYQDMFGYNGSRNWNSILKRV